jgi:hypothetical protein
VASESSCCEWNIAFTHRKEFSTSIYQQPHHLNISFHASNMKGRITKIACLVQVNTGINKSFGCRNVIPSDNAMKSIVAIAGASVHVRKVDIREIGGCTELSKRGTLATTRKTAAN